MPIRKTYQDFLGLINLRFFTQGSAIGLLSYIVIMGLTLLLHVALLIRALIQ